MFVENQSSEAITQESCSPKPQICVKRVSSTDYNKVSATFHAGTRSPIGLVELSDETNQFWQDF